MPPLPAFHSPLQIFVDLYFFLLGLAFSNNRP
jgi:hypothetical protein